DDIRNVVSDEARRVGAHAPFAHFLAEKRTGFPSDSAIEIASPGERLTTDRHIHAERDTSAVSNRGGPEIEYGEDAAQNFVAGRQPGGPFAWPDRNHATTDVIATVRLESGSDSIKPVRPDPD